MKKDAFISQLFAAHQSARQNLSPNAVCKMVNHLLKLLFPELSDLQYRSEREFKQDFLLFETEFYNLLEAVEDLLKQDINIIEKSFHQQIPSLLDLLDQDAAAILAGDPAATTRQEVIRTYPGFYAIAIYRIANALFRLEVPLIPRILTEYAHGKTGIDIHPGATIGKRFCIDHGTGVVIGETVEIGEDVKLYQGVTLGALSVSKEMAKTKRHPTIENRVIIYAGVTILGGKTIIGHDSVIGGNVWITKSVPAHSRVYYKKENIDKQEFKSSDNPPPHSSAY